ncbi:glycosyl hydrolase family 71-domain-containing protein [Echria macrotheca]|uniref:Glycosyl hydrolase family 71-domain-containing protein n=1 Tax=Echria macrotheca TaxID=438768 RepID=A0AAJ0BG04_9PEZI|nr:glycosyl hydrolase family 71-domain-containing protein [Echria macrotheca]
MLLLFLFVFIVSSAHAAKDVFAHYLVGNAGSLTQQDWAADIRSAKAALIDGFALNIAEDEPMTATSLKNAFAAAEAADFKLFLSFNRVESGSWSKDTVVSLIQALSKSSAYFHTHGRPLVSTCEESVDTPGWSNTKAATNRFLIPDWIADDDDTEANSAVEGLLDLDAWSTGEPLPKMVRRQVFVDTTLIPDDLLSSLIDNPSVATPDEPDTTITPPDDPAFDSPASTPPSPANSTLIPPDNSTATSPDNTTPSPDNSTITAPDNSTLTSPGNTNVTAPDNSTLTAPNSTVVDGNSTVVTNTTLLDGSPAALPENSTLPAVDNSTLVVAPDNSTRLVPSFTFTAPNSATLVQLVRDAPASLKSLVKKCPSRLPLCRLLARANAG